MSWGKALSPNGSNMKRIGESGLFENICLHKLGKYLHARKGEKEKRRSDFYVGLIDGEKERGALWNRNPEIAHRYAERMAPPQDTGIGAWGTDSFGSEEA